MIKIAHIINPVVVPKTSDLFVAQPVTFATMITARDFALKQVEVSLLTAQFTEDRGLAPLDNFKPTPDLDRSILDIASFKKNRKLPFIKDILDRAFEAAPEADYLIYTNVDIGLMPHFYVAVSRLLEAGFDALVINRRTISNQHQEVDQIPLMYSDLGQIHPGFDCFVFRRDSYPKYVLTDICIGANLIGTVLLFNLLTFSDNFTEVKDAHLTFHIGDDMAWKSEEVSDYSAHNIRQSVKILVELEKASGNRIENDGRYISNIKWINTLKGNLDGTNRCTDSAKCAQVNDATESMGAPPEQTRDKETPAAARLIAYYLPQYHPIPENNLWWSEGFTEWTNTSKGISLFPNHYQPRLPGDLGFYDLRVPETRIAQAELARKYGIEGFLYWHYWFAGKRLLERPFNEVLATNEPRFPFCLGWANESWTGVWHGCPDRVLMEQTYPGPEDETQHFYAVLDAFFDERYITIENKPVFYIYGPQNIPDAKRFVAHWQELAIKEGLSGIYFIANGSPLTYGDQGYDGFAQPNPGMTFAAMRNPPPGVQYNMFNKLAPKQSFLQRLLTSKKALPASQPNVFLYEDYIKLALPGLNKDYDEYPCVLPNWDNTARCGTRAHILHKSTPELFRTHLREAISQVSDRNYEKRIVFIKSWNEWAEGNYLEPDQRFGREYLQVCKDEVSGRRKDVHTNDSY